jgi:hypothetical protein
MDHSIKTGTVTGTAVTVLCSITWTDIERTLVLGTIGAAISFLVSYGLKSLIERKGKT